MLIRRETPADRDPVAAVNRDAFADMQPGVFRYAPPFYA